MTVNSKGWTYSKLKNRYVMPKKEYAVYPPLLSKKISPSDARSITIKVKGEALTAVNDLEHKHDTRCRKKKSERRLTINQPPLILSNHARALALLSPTVPSPSKSLQQKNRNAENASWVSAVAAQNLSAPT